MRGKPGTVEGLALHRGEASRIGMQIAWKLGAGYASPLRQPQHQQGLVVLSRGVAGEALYVGEHPVAQPLDTVSGVAGEALLQAVEAELLGLPLGARLDQAV